MKFVKMIRFDHSGFTCGHPKLGCMDDPVFINREIHNLFQTGQAIFTSEMILPKDSDRQWSGCYCYLEESRQMLSENRTIGFLPRESSIWVRNRSHFDGGIPYYSRSIHPLVEEEEDDQDNMMTHTWVQMSVEDALERTRLWKQEYAELPDWITECYLMEGQVKNLVYPSTKEKVMEFWLSKN